MPPANEFVTSVLEIIAPLGDVNYRSMFGGYGIFFGDSMFALITQDNRLFLKADNINRPLFEKLGLEPFGKMPYYAAPQDSLNGWPEMEAWARGSVAAAERAKSSRGARVKSKSPRHSFRADIFPPPLVVSLSNHVLR